MQRLSRCFTVRYQRQADVTGPWVGPVELRSRKIASGHHAHARVLVEFDRRRLVAAVLRYVEPNTKAPGGPPIPITIAEDLVGEIEFDPVQPAVLLDMRLVAIGNGRDMLEATLKTAWLIARSSHSSTSKVCQAN